MRGVWLPVTYQNRFFVMTYVNLLNVMGILFKKNGAETSRDNARKNAYSREGQVQVCQNLLGLGLVRFKFQLLNNCVQHSVGQSRGPTCTLTHAWR